MRSRALAGSAPPTPVLGYGTSKSARLGARAIPDRAAPPRHAVRHRRRRGLVRVRHHDRQPRLRAFGRARPAPKSPATGSPWRPTGLRVASRRARSHSSSRSMTEATSWAGFTPCRPRPRGTQVRGWKGPEPQAARATPSASSACACGRSTSRAGRSCTACCVNPAFGTVGRIQWGRHASMRPPAAGRRSRDCATALAPTVKAERGIWVDGGVAHGAQPQVALPITSRCHQPKLLAIPNSRLWSRLNRRKTRAVACRPAAVRPRFGRVAPAELAVHWTGRGDQA